MEVPATTLEIIQSIYSPDKPGNMKLLTTVAIRQMLIDFSGLNITIEEMHAAMTALKFRITKAENKLYWEVYEI